MVMTDGGKVIFLKYIQRPTYPYFNIAFQKKCCPEGYVTGSVRWNQKSEGYGS